MFADEWRRNLLKIYFYKKKTFRIFVLINIPTKPDLFDDIVVITKVNIKWYYHEYGDYDQSRV